MLLGYYRGYYISTWLLNLVFGSCESKNEYISSITQGLDSLAY